VDNFLLFLQYQHIYQQLLITLLTAVYKLAISRFGLALREKSENSSLLYLKYAQLPIIAALSVQRIGEGLYSKKLLFSHFFPNASLSLLLLATPPANAILLQPFNLAAFITFSTKTSITAS